MLIDAKLLIFSTLTSLATLAHITLLQLYTLKVNTDYIGTIRPRVQIDGVLFVRMCKSTGYYLSACAKMTRYYLSGVLFVRYPLLFPVLIIGFFLLKRKTNFTSRNRFKLCLLCWVDIFLYFKRLTLFI